MKDVSMLGVVVLGSVIGVTGGALAGRPLAIDDADPTAPGGVEFEAGVCYEHASECTHWDYPLGMAYGLVHGVEVGIGFGGQLEERTEVIQHAGVDETHREQGVGDLAIGAKWQFMESCPLGARHALVPMVKFPTADDDKDLGSGKTDYDLTWIVSRALGEKAGVHLNLGYSWIGGPDADVLHCGLALDSRIRDEVQWVGEVFAEEELVRGADTVVQCSTGLRWSPSESLTFDIAGGSKISGDAPDFIATAGLTWAFGFGNNDSK